MRWGCLAALAMVVAVPAAAGSPGDAPPARVVPFSETVQGIPVSDPYRWMETGGPDYDAWLRAQSEVAANWLAALPRRADLLKAVEARSGAFESVGQIARRGRYVFLARRPAGAQTSQLVVRDGIAGTERVLFDPATLDTAEAKGNALNYWEASPDGAHVYLGVSPGGSEQATLKVIETATGRFIDGDVPQALFNGGTLESGGILPQWLPDGSGFFYNRLAEGARPGTPDYYLNTRLFLRKIGTGAANDRLILTRGAPGAPPMSPAEAPFITCFPGSSVALLNIADGVARAMRLLRAPLSDVLAGTAKWVPVTQAADEVESVALVRDDLYLVRRDGPRGRVIKFTGADPARASEVVPQGPGVIENLVATREGIYIIGRNAEGVELRLLKDGQVRPVALPFPGMSYLYDGTTAQEGLLFSLENYVTPRQRLLVTGDRASDTGLGPIPPFDVNAYMAETVLVTARDGTQVPLDMVRRKDLPRDGKRPVLLDAYGAYGFSGDPYFNPRLYALLDAGGIYATAKVRGGGEFGRDWWLAGKQATKPNTWRDAIDSALWLRGSGWTSDQRITLWGTSAGGIMVGRGVTERPDLWAGAIASVGILNAMRFEFGPNGQTNVQEFGSVATPAGAKALRAMDAYLSIEPGTDYPPMLITAGANDPRVIAWQPAKFAARLQAVGKGGPFLFEVDFDQGHGVGSTRSQADRKAADIAAFTLWAAERAR